MKIQFLMLKKFSLCLLHGQVFLMQEKDGDMTWWFGNAETESNVDLDTKVASPHNTQEQENVTIVNPFKKEDRNKFNVDKSAQIPHRVCEKTKRHPTLYKYIGRWK